MKTRLRWVDLPFGISELGKDSAILAASVTAPDRKGALSAPSTVALANKTIARSTVVDRVIEFSPPEFAASFDMIEVRGPSNVRWRLRVRQVIE